MRGDVREGVTRRGRNRLPNTSLAHTLILTMGTAQWENVAEEKVLFALRWTSENRVRTLKWKNV